MRTIFLFSNFSPNQQGGTFYYLDNPTQFNIRFNDKIALSIEDNNYRINANVLKIKHDKTKAESYYKNMTYLMLKDDENAHENRFYFIKSMYIQSGNVSFSLELDLWQTYINFASFKYTKITRSNKRLGIGFYAPITQTSDQLNEDFVYYDNDEYGTISDEYVDVVFLLQYNVKQQVFFGDEYITKTSLFTLNTRQTKEFLTTIHSDLDNISSLELTLDLIGLIYGVDATIGVNDARVLKAWVIDNRLINTEFGDGTKQVFKATTKSSFKSAWDITTEITRVLPSRHRKAIEIEDYDVNKVYILGTYNNGLELKRFATPTLKASYYVITTEDDLQIIVQQGNIQYDITSGFEVALTTNGETETGIRKIAKGFKRSNDHNDKLFKGWEKGGNWGAIKGQVDFLASNIPLKPAFADAIGNGDGLYNFYYEQYRELAKGRLKSPYVITYTTSIIDERKRTLYEGAYFEEIITTNNLLSDAINAPYLFDNMTENETLTFPTLIACETFVENVPTIASEHIKNLLRNGIRISK